MSVITYYLGAGASANCIPVNNQLPQAVENFTNNFIYNVNQLKNLAGNMNLSQFKDIIYKFARNVHSNPTVDIYARKLFLQGEPRLYWFKNCLELFFLYCQLVNPPDYRYEFLLASFIEQVNGMPKLNKNVNVITWNYDNQIELAYSRYFNKSTDSSFPELQKHLKTYPFYGVDKNASIAVDEYNIVKLNGGVGLQEKHNGFYYSKSDIWWNTMDDKNRRSPLSETHKFIISDPIIFNLLDYYINYARDKSNAPENPYFTYSWEGKNISKNSLKIAQHIAQKTDILVLCGYSFPYINSQMDKAILSKMENVKYIYYQDHEKDDDLYLSIETRLRQLTPERDVIENEELNVYPKIQRIRFTKEFYIPHDLELDK